MVKKLLLLCLFMAGMLPAEAVVVVRLTGGTAGGYEMSDVSDVRFMADGGVVLSLVSGETVEVSADEFVALEFTDENGICSVAEDGAQRFFVIEGGSIVSTDGAALTVYTLAGAEVAHSSEGRISLDGLSKGGYVVSSGTNSEKVIVR